jgi:hypothetical protein
METQHKRRWPLHAPPPFEAVRVVDPAPDTAATLKAVERMKATFPAVSAIKVAQHRPA